jgi:hypothetical protein
MKKKEKEKEKGKCINPKSLINKREKNKENRKEQGKEVNKIAGAIKEKD